MASFTEEGAPLLGFSLALSIVAQHTDVWSAFQPIKALADFTTASIFRLPILPSSRLSTLSTARKFLWLCTAFFITASVHVVGERMLIGRLGFGAFTFFMLQPLGISIESAATFLWNLHNLPKTISSGTALTPSSSTVNDVAKRPSVWIRCIGYTWVASWFIWSLTFMIDPMVQVGMFVDPRADMRRWEWPFGGMENYSIAIFSS